MSLLGFLVRVNISGILLYMCEYARDTSDPDTSFMKLGRSIRYRKDDLDLWLSLNRVVRYLP